jgi:phosphatidate cytidylyltransferase
LHRRTAVDIEDLALLRWRLILGTLFIAALVMMCWLDYRIGRPGLFLLPLALMLSWFGVVELLEMFEKRGRKPLPWAMFAGVLGCVALAGMPVIAPSAGETIGRLGWLAIGLGVGFFVLLVGELQRYDGRWHSTINLGLLSFAVLYLGGLMGFIVQLRMLGGAPWGDDGRWGMLALISLIAVVKMSDTGQYTIGRLVGRHKMAPQVSPGKTWEGAAGGILFAIAAAWFVFGWAARWVVPTSNYGDTFLESAERPLAATLFAVAVAIAGIVGDLGESMLKRDAGVKDSSTWLPGFGGVLDLLDSLLGAAPVAYLFWALRIVGP